MRGRPAGTIALIVVLCATGGLARAGGPLLLRADGTPYVYDTAAPISYRTDNGPLSASVAEGAAQTRVQSMFNVWQNVPSASISYTRGGFINNAGTFTDGNVSTADEYDEVVGSCEAATQSPIIYDEAAQILIDLGDDETSIIGFAAPCSLDPGAGEFLTGQVLMNGLFQDGQAAPVQDLSAALFDAAFIHEFGHFSGLDHSQVNVNCTGFCGADDLAGLPTMFPLATDESQGSLSIDDVAWISKLYPAGGASGFTATHGHITGTVYFSDGQSQAQLVNVVARRVDNPRTTAGSSVSGYRFRFFNDNSINNAGDEFGSQIPAHLGLYEIPLPPGIYTVEFESVDPGFVDGSSVGGPQRIAMPGTSPGPLGPITVTAGATSSGHDVTLIGTAPRFDQFEGP